MSARIIPWLLFFWAFVIGMELNGPWSSRWNSTHWQFSLALAAFWACCLWFEFVRRSRITDKGPPRLAEFLLCIFARTKDIEALMGDFEELFERDCTSGTHRRAVIRYWARVIRSVGPQMWQAVKRVGWLGLIAAALRSTKG
jgi:hypothetical protein